MEMREWAIRILSADCMEEKLLDPVVLTDEQPGPALFWKEPIRPSGMGFCRQAKRDKLPHLQEHGDPEKRAACLHRFAGHELLAVEIMAYALLAFPESPKHFRKGLANTLKEEQEHVQLYTKQLNRLGVCLGDFPLYRNFWKHTPYLTSPLHYVSVMSLTLEMANLDFAPIYGKSFRLHGDLEAANLMDTILQDEIRHVGFGWHWMRSFKQNDTPEWEAWTNTLSTTLLTPKRAQGFYMHEEPRRQAGVSDAWISSFKKLR